MDESSTAVVIGILQDSLSEGYGIKQTLELLSENAFFDLFLDPLDLSSLTVDNEENLKSIILQVKDESLRDLLTNEEVAIWYIELVEALYGSAKALEITDPYFELWKSIPRILYKISLLQFYEKQYTDAKNTIENALTLSDSTSINYELFPMKILYASLLTEQQLFAEAEKIFLDMNETLEKLLETEDAKNKFYKLIYTYHTTYAIYHYVQENYEQTVYLLERVGNLYGIPKDVLEDEFITILAQCYEFLGQQELKDRLLEN